MASPSILSQSAAMGGAPHAGERLFNLRDAPSPHRAVAPALSVAVLLPCHNEASTINEVVRDFRKALPAASIYVYDNASTDKTAAIADQAGAIVRRTNILGKGNVLRRMFSAIDADVFILADGDGTYDAYKAPDMIEHLQREHLDMVVGQRIDGSDATNVYRTGHRLGNRLLNLSVRWLFGNGSRDMLSGYRVFSRRYVRSFPAFSRGFEIETEMTVHALDICIPFEELPTAYRERAGGSPSKLRTIPDGLKILKLILLLWKDYRPLRFFGCVGLQAAFLAIISGLWAHGHLHNWTPATFFTVGFAAIASISLLAAIMLDSLGRTRREVKRMLFLAAEPDHRGAGEGQIDLTSSRHAGPSSSDDEMRDGDADIT